ncbi:MAG: dual specificity protein phosphatase family protein [Thermodesulfobacteriota bacterium]
MAERFSWVVKDFIAGMERPGLYQNLEKDLQFLNDNGINVIVNLEEYFWEYPQFEVLHLPIADFNPPMQDDFENFIEFVSARLEEDKRILVHCHAGMGRTNVMIASYLVYKDKVKPEDALEIVKKLRPAHMVNDDQEKALWDFYYSVSAEK